MNAYSGRLVRRVVIVLPTSGDATWITGQIIVCDGGVSLTGWSG
ncbi:hypothetical protein AB0J27_26895 [Micromonospora chokoriensis]